MTPSERYAATPTHRLIARFHAFTASDQAHPADLLAELNARGIDTPALEDTTEAERASILREEITLDIERFTEIEAIRRQEKLPAGLVSTFHMRHLREIAASPDQFDI